MIERGFQTDELPGAPGTGSRYSRNSVMVDLVGMSPTTSSTMERKWQPEIDSKAVNYRRIGKKQVYRAIFPSNFNVQNNRAAWAGSQQPGCSWKTKFDTPHIFG